MGRGHSCRIRNGRATQVMSGIRIIKLMAWESSFVAKIGAIRDAELKALRKAAILKSLCVHGIVFSCSMVSS